MKDSTYSFVSDFDSEGHVKSMMRLMNEWKSKGTGVVKLSVVQE
jgi:hypothetical protein